MVHEYLASANIWDFSVTVGLNSCHIRDNQYFPDCSICDAFWRVGLVKILV